MHQTVYIDVDEEITGILDRIRQEQAVDIFLVIPKGAMLLNSIINLKLLKKEAEKIGKIITILAPNDKQAKVIIERAGIKFEDYNQRLNDSHVLGAEQSINRENVRTEHINQAIEESVGETQQQIMRGDLNIGSNSFFSQQVNGNSTSNNQAQKQPFIKQEEEIKSSQEEQLNYSGESKNQLESTDDKMNYFKSKTNIDTRITTKTANDKGKFFKKKGLITILVVVIIGMLGASGWYVAHYPKLSLNIQPLKKNVTKEIKIIVKDEINSIDIDKKNIPGEYLEMSVEKSLEFKTTGSKIIDKNGAKATGTVIITNYFSEKSQPLVETTRVLSKSGKLFRLKKSVVVPGKKGDQPGKIKVTVQADKPGKDFNIAKDSFTIEGFKGSPKYEKFKVISEGPMTGGVTSNDSKEKKIVSKADLDMARKKTIQALDNALKDEINKRLNSEQQIVESSIEKEIISNKTSHLVNTITDKFFYTITYKVKVIAFYNNDIETIVKELIKKDLGRKYKLNTGFKTTISRGIVNLDKKSLTIYVNIKGDALFTIDQAKLKERIKGVNLEEAKKIFNKGNGVTSVEFNPAPAWSKKAPNNINNINIKIIQ